MLRVRLKRLLGGDTETARLQDNVQAALDDVAAVTILGGRQIEDVALVTGGEDNVVNHGLERPLQGYMVVRKDTETTIWDTQGSNPTQSKTLTLRCGADCTVSLWVF